MFFGVISQGFGFWGHLGVLGSIVQILGSFVGVLGSFVQILVSFVGILGSSMRF